MNITYQSPIWKPELVAARYVRCSASGVFSWAEANAQNWDIRQGTCTADELPADVRKKALARRGQAFGAVDWPL